LWAFGERARLLPATAAQSPTHATPRRSALALSLSLTHQVKGLLEIVSAASEFDSLPLRPGEEGAVQRMISHAPVAVDRPRFSDPHTKVNALLQVRSGLWVWW
jgi:hypothetical protein